MYTFQKCFKLAVLIPVYLFSFARRTHMCAYTLRSPHNYIPFYNLYAYITHIIILQMNFSLAMLFCCISAVTTVIFTRYSTAWRPFLYPEPKPLHASKSENSNLIFHYVWWICCVYLCTEWKRRLICLQMLLRWAAVLCVVLVELTCRLTPLCLSRQLCYCPGKRTIQNIWLQSRQHQTVLQQSAPEMICH